MRGAWCTRPRTSISRSGAARPWGSSASRGSGKSTVARCIARLIEPTAGAILLDGDDIAHASDRRLRRHRRRVQIVFQDPYRSLNPRRTVGQSIVEGPMNFGLATAEAWQRAADLMALVRPRRRKRSTAIPTSSPAASASASASPARSRWSPTC